MLARALDTLIACFRRMFARPSACLLVIVLVLLNACDAPKQPPPGTERPQIYTTIPPFASILRPIVGDRAEVKTLLSAGASPHTHDPRPSDVRSIHDATALFYGAPTLDAWAAALPGRAHVALIDLLPPSARLALPDGGGPDPHFWTDPVTVKALLPALTDTLCALDADGCATFRSRAAPFARRLDSLDARLRSELAPVRGKRVMMTHPFFAYFLRRYGIDTAPTIEPAPGKEPSPRALQRLIQDVRTGHVDAIVAQPQLPPRAARAIAEATRLPVVQLDPIGAPGESYVDLLDRNARTLVEALR